LERSFMSGSACAFTTRSGMVLCCSRQVAIIRQSSLACLGNKRPVPRAHPGTDWIATAPAGDEADPLSLVKYSQMPRSGRDPRRRPELRTANFAAQTRIVSVARIRLLSGESARPFKEIFCDDISEFESHMPSHAVQSLPAMSRSQNLPSAIGVSGGTATTSVAWQRATGGDGLRARLLLLLS
jgi:hypothetical protein